MKILIVGKSDLVGGAALASFRLAVELSKSHDVKMLVEDRKSDLPWVQSLPVRYDVERHLKYLWEKWAIPVTTLGSWSRIAVHPWFKDADVVNYHVCASPFLGLPQLEKLWSLKPSVLTLHDMWLLSGYCSYSFDCEKWLIGCGNCPQIGALLPKRTDHSAAEWKLKKRLLDSGSFVVVSPSHWLHERVVRSRGAGNRSIVIPNGIDVERYQARDPLLCRQMLGIPEKDFVILFGAFSIQDYRKGGDLLLKAVQQMTDDEKSRVTLCVLGSAGSLDQQLRQVSLVEFGYTNNDRIKNAIFSAADTFVLPSRAENHSLMILESLASGTPVIASHVGGNPESICDGENGYLFENGNAADLLLKLRMMIAQTPAVCFRARARESAVKQFNSAEMAARYSELFEQSVPGVMGR